MDGQYDGPGSLEMLFNRRSLHQSKCQRDRFTTLNGVEVLYNRFREAFHCRTTEATPSMGDERGKSDKVSNNIQFAASR